MASPDKKLANDTFVILCTLALGATIVAILYFCRAILIPGALAILLTFVLSPLVTRLEKGIGRTKAICSVALVIFTAFGIGSWVIVGQTVDLLSKLPDYRANIEKKLHAFEPGKNSPLKKFSQMVAEIESDQPRATRAPEPAVALSSEPELSAPADQAPTPVVPPADLMQPWRRVIRPLFDGVATTGVVLLLVVFMLLKREDIRARFVKIVSRGRISTTARAMEEAADRVSRFLFAQLIVNLAFGVAIAAGLLLIGVPNAFLWGALAATSRFIPYIGVPLGALGPLALAMAISPGWAMLMETAVLFAALELATANALEPVLFRSSTGVSSLALIGAAIFWGWLWGPVGLILSTPLTVCLAVIGKHFRRLSYLSVLLGNDEAFTPTEDCYHRLLMGGRDEAIALAEVQVKTRSLLALYEEVLIPTLLMAQRDYDRSELEESQRDRVIRGVREMVEDLSSLTPADSAPVENAVPVERTAATPGNSDFRVALIPVKAEEDEIAAAMTAHLLRDHQINATLADRHLPPAELFAWLRQQHFDLVCLCAMPPSTLAQTKQLCTKLRAQCPGLDPVVAFWGDTDTGIRAMVSIQGSGLGRVTVTLKAAVKQIADASVAVLDKLQPAPEIPDEIIRLASLRALKIYAAKSDPVFDRMTKDLTRVFDVPIALFTLIDQDRQLFKSQFGLPEQMSPVCEIPRTSSICSHVVAANSIMVVEDLTRDRRFASNPLLRENNLRFYAGVPLRAPDGQPVGALCILDIKPRTFSAAERRMLLAMGDLMSKEVALLGPSELVAAPSVA